MAIDARLRLRLRRNEARAFPVRIIGLAGYQLRSAAPYMQVRDGLDVPGPPRIALAAIADNNVDGLGLRVVDLDPIDGKPACLLVIQVDKATADDAEALPYGALGETREMRWALAWSGQQRLGGVLEVLGAVIGADNAPADRELSYGATAQGGGLLEAGATVTIAGEEVVELVVDGAGDAFRAEAAAIRAETFAGSYYRSVAGYGDREDVRPASSRPYGLMRWVENATPYPQPDGSTKFGPPGRLFRWTKDEFGPGLDGWSGFANELETKLIAVDAANTAFGRPQAERIAVLETQTIANFRAEKVGEQFVITWDLAGPQPSFQRIEWGGWMIEVDGACRSLILPGLEDGSRFVVIGDSMSDGVRAAGTWPQKLALRTGASLAVVALYSAGSKQVYRSGAAPVRITVTGDVLPVGGTPVDILTINGAAPGASNPATLFYTYLEDTAPDSMPAIVGGRLGRITTTARGRGGKYQWVSDVGQTAAHIGPDALLVPAFAANMARDEMLIWDSQNDFYSGVQQIVNGVPQYISAGKFAKTASMIRMGRGAPVSVLGLLPDASWINGTREQGAMKAYIAEQQRLWPHDFARDLQGRNLYERMLASGNGSAGDNADIANGVVPRSLRRDSLHLNDAGNEVVAQFMAEWRAIRPKPPRITIDTWFTLYAGSATAAAKVEASRLDPVLAATSADVLDSTSPVNKAPRKRAGATVFDTDRARPLWASGAEPSSAWVDAAGAVAAAPFNTYQGWETAFDFKNQQYRSGGLATRDITALPDYQFARAGQRYEMTPGGVLMPFADNVPAIVQGSGLFYRSGLTNYVPNSMMAGAATGVLPNGWSKSKEVEVVGSGVENGLPYIDVRFFVDNRASSAIAYVAVNAMTGATGAQTAPGEPWTASAFAKLISGSFNGGQARVQLRESTDAGVYLTNKSTELTRDAIADKLARVSCSAAMANANTRRVHHSIECSIFAGQLFDITIRLAGPQLEKGLLNGPFVPTTNGAVILPSDSLRLGIPNGPADTDYVILAAVNYPLASAQETSNPRVWNVQTPDNVLRLSAYRNAGGGTMTAYIQPGDATTIARPGTGATGAFPTAGRSITAFRRQGDGYVFSSRTPAGLVAHTGRVVSPAPERGVRYAPDPSINAPLEFFGYRRGTFSDAEVEQMMRVLAG